MTGMKRAVILAALLWVAAISSGPAASAQQTAVADLVIRNGKVVTLSGVGDGAPEAQAVAIVGHSIAAVGSDAEIEYTILGGEVRYWRSDPRLVAERQIDAFSRHDIDSIAGTYPSER